MPELPEVETVRRILEKKCLGKTIELVKVRYSKLVDYPSVKTFQKRLVGQTFRKFMRRGKYLIFELDQDILIAHMRMEGKFYFTKDDSIIDRHTHAIFTFTDGNKLFYHDTRKFGRMELYHKGEELSVISSLGLEPFDPSLTVEYLNEHVGKKRKLKEWLLDQSIIAGIGNIHANEICYAIGRRPSTRYETLTIKQKEDLIEQTRRILKGAIKAGGTTIRSYTSQLGVTGRFQLQVHVHGKEKETCPRCGSTIKKVQLGGRGTYYCPGCQK